MHNILKNLPNFSKFDINFHKNLIVTNIYRVVQKKPDPKLNSWFTKPKIFFLKKNLVMAKLWIKFGSFLTKVM